MDTNFGMTPDWVTAIATIILVAATCIYVYFSYKLTKETIKLREVETSPFISIILPQEKQTIFKKYFVSNKLSVLEIEKKR